MAVPDTRRGAVAITLWPALRLKCGVGVQGPQVGRGGAVNGAGTERNAQGIVPTGRADPRRCLHADDLGRQGAPKACATSTVTPVRIPAAEEEHLGAILVEGRGP